MADNSNSVVNNSNLTVNSNSVVNVVVTHQGLVLDYKHLLDHLDKFIITRSKKVGKKEFVKTINLYKIIGDKIIIPKFSGLTKILNGCQFKTVPLMGKTITDCSFELDLYDYQEVIYNHFMENIFNERRLNINAASGVLVLGTGLGKTRTSLSFIEPIGKKTLILLPNKTGLQDWIDAVKEAYPKLDLGFNYSTKKTDGDIVIMTAGCATKNKITVDKVEVDRAEYFKQFGFVIIDEIHSWVSETRREIFWHVMNQYVLGLTATPDEDAEQLDEIYYKHVGIPIIAKDLPGFNTESTKWKGEVKAIHYHCEKQYAEQLKNCMDSPDVVALEKQLVRDPRRNQLCIDEILAIKNRNVYVFAEHHKMLDTIGEMLTAAGIPEYSGTKLPVSWTKLTGESNSGYKLTAEKDVNIILTTYNYSKQSLNIMKMDAMVMCSPRKNKLNQIIGRITRKGSDIAKVRLIVDIIDESVILGHQHKKRKEVYKNKEFVVTDVNVR